MIQFSRWRCPLRQVMPMRIFTHCTRMAKPNLQHVRGCRHMRSVGSKSPAPLLPRRAAAVSKPRKIERQSSPSSASSSDDSAATLVDAAAITQQVRPVPTESQACVHIVCMPSCAVPVGCSHTSSVVVSIPLPV